MKNYDKVVQERFLDNEEEIIVRLKRCYNIALRDINNKIKNLLSRDDADMQYVIYQVEYQKALKKQIEGILDTLYANEFDSIAEYLTKSYDDGFIGAMYSIHQQGIPLTFPIDQEAVVRAVQLDSKISVGLYTRLGEDIAELKKKISSEVSRAVSNGTGYRQIALQLKAQTNIGYNNAIRIARTEGHRIQTEAGMDAAVRAKDKGCNVVKQWDSTLDRKVRKSHQSVDGEIREIDEPFSNGLMFPGDPNGKASEVINCRCALLQRAKWALDESELETLKERAAYYGLDKAKNFEDFKQKYLKAASNT